MKNPLLHENHLFIPALLLSAGIHGLLFSVSGWMPSAPEVSVLQAPNSPEITVISRPVVTVIEEEIVSEEIIEDEAVEEIVFRSKDADLKPEKSVGPPVISRESRGAVTGARPLTHVNPAPPYPRMARQRGWEGIVRLKVLVGEDGATRQVDVQKSSGYGILDKAALRTVRGWKFSPAKSGSLRFSSRIIIPIQFTLVRE